MRVQVAFWTTSARSSAPLRSRLVAESIKDQRWRGWTDRPKDIVWEKIQVLADVQVIVADVAVRHAY